ncbi:hypothetical protein HDR66_01520 [bacterium]|nr:hypothetical protein [bacterium]
MQLGLSRHFYYLAAMFWPVFDANAWYVSSDQYGDILVIDTDTTITSDMPIDHVQRIYVTQSVSLINDVTVDTDIYICDTCHVNIINRGYISSKIYIGTNADLTQIIETANDITTITTNGAYNILVVNANGISWNDITNTQYDATSITIKDSVIIIDNTLATCATSPQISFTGTNKIILITPHVAPGYTIPIMPTTETNATLEISIPGLNKLYRSTGYIENNYLYAKILRETDYVKIFNDARGKFLNRIQQTNPNDKLIKHMNRATDMNELYKIMNRSIRFRPALLMNPLKTLNQYMSGRQFRPKNKYGELNIAPFTIYDASTSATYGIHGEITTPITRNTDINIGGYSGILTYDTNLDTAGGTLYGGEIGITSNANQIYWNIYSGITGANIKTPELFNGQHAIKPIIAHTNINIGPIINLNREITAIPFAGISASYGYANHESDIEISPHIGGDIKFKFIVTDIEYTYHFHADIGIENYTAASFGIMGASHADQMAIGFDVGIINNEYTTSYHASIIGKLYF